MIETPDEFKEENNVSRNRSNVSSPGLRPKKLEK